jgi:hypothetical protein
MHNVLAHGNKKERKKLKKNNVTVGGAPCR